MNAFIQHVAFRNPMRLICLLTWLAFLPAPLRAAESWQSALARMPLATNVTELTRSNFAEVLLSAFQSNATVKALVLLPGATDEFYFFQRAHARLTNATTLLDAVMALTNQTLLRTTFHPPLLLLHTAEDPVTALIKVENEATARQLRGTRFVPHFVYNDHDWNFVQPILDRTLAGRFTGWPEFLPPVKTPDSWHFFRHFVAGWNLDGWEALEALSLANKTTVTVKKRRVIFAGDTRNPAESGGK